MKIRSGFVSNSSSSSFIILGSCVTEQKAKELGFFDTGGRTPKDMVLRYDECSSTPEKYIVGITIDRVDECGSFENYQTLTLSQLAEMAKKVSEFTGKPAELMTRTISS